MPLAELQQRLGLTDHMAGLQGSGHAAEEAVKAEAAGLPTMNGHQQPAGDTAAGPAAADVLAVDGAAAAEGAPNGDAATGTAGDVPSLAVKAEPGSAAALEADHADEAGDASLAPVYDLYEALLRVLLQVQNGCPCRCSDLGLGLR